MLAVVPLGWNDPEVVGLGARVGVRRVVRLGWNDPNVVGPGPLAGRAPRVRPARTAMMGSMGPRR